MSTEPILPSLFDLRGRVALVTGAAGHLGVSLATALAEAGASVVTASRDVHRARTVAEALPRIGDAAHRGVAIDYLDEDSIRQGFADALQLGGRIDVLINNGHEGMADDWTSITAAAFDRQLRNATGYFLAARLLREHAVGRSAPAAVIMLGSMYGLVGSYPQAYENICPASSVAYHTLKGGILELTRHLAVYWAPDGVRVNALSPGPFPAPSAPPAMVERLIAHSPMRRIGRPHELKGAVVFLASDASSYVTGHNLVVDGGWTAW